MDTTEKKHIKHMCYLGLTIAVFVGGVWIHQQDTISSNDQAVHTIQLKANHYKSDREGYTVAKLRKNYDDSEPNLGTTLSSNQHKVQAGLQLAFTNCKSLRSLGQAKPKVTSELGSEITNPLFNSLENQIKTSDSTGSQKRTKGDSISMLHVSYGKYDDDESIIPVEVLVKYTTPPIKQDDGAGSLKPVGQKKTSPIHKGYLEFDATLNPKTKTMSLNHYHNQLQHDSDS